MARKTGYVVKIRAGLFRAKCTKCNWHFSAAHWHTAALAAARHKHDD